MVYLRKVRTMIALIVSSIVIGSVAFADDVITFAEADTITGESLINLIAFERAKARGVNAEAISLQSDDLVFQAVLNGQVEVGVGSAYAALQTLGAEAPVRNFYQLKKLGFLCVVNKNKIKSWKDLDGQPITIHARGSGTEAISYYMEKVHDIKFSELSFVPGSEVRAIALLKGTIDATFLDITNTRLVLAEDPEKFGILALGDVDGSDSLLFARTDFLSDRAGDIQILLEELMRAAREINADPTLPARLREEMGLLPDLPQELVDEITPYFETAVRQGMFAEDGGGLPAALGDFEFLTASGGLQGPSSDLNPDNFWNFELLDKARAALN
ncbi:MAG: ABC transporter substrate-binding protein [Rhodobacteraceae bacterium]|nr:ABC transporter substrate-binding protein [Paracoccaceae bacterium]MYI91933.1 ABC transporter substrate-binding protein [Paracoccaceae bacterium]